jgi:hypothetical protein
MKPFVRIHPRLFAALFLGFLAFKATATTYYVDINSTNPAPPYTNWCTASTDIQSAVNLTTNGDLVLVNPGVYRSGGYVASDGSTNTIVISNAITLESMDGAAATLICGSNNMRCIYLANGAILSGFTLTNGLYGGPAGALLGGSGGGVYCTSTNVIVTNCVLINNTSYKGAGAYAGTLNNCILQGNNALINGGGAYMSILNNCILAGNSETNLEANFGIPGGGGAAYCTLNDCYLNNNFSTTGGGALYSTLNNCIVSNNVAMIGNSVSAGGGVFACSVQNSLIVSNSAHANLSHGVFGIGGGATGSALVNDIIQGNSADEGGGVDGGAMSDCIIIGNSAIYGGGVYTVSALKLTNCVIFGNQASEYGGAYSYGTSLLLLNCSVIGNSATNSYGGIYCGLAENSIVYYNNAPQFPDAGGSYSAHNCCFGQDVSSGSGFFTNAPLFVNLATDDFYLQSNSPCINAGNNAYITLSNDLAGNPRIVGGTVDIGAYEYQTPVSMVSYQWLEQYGLPITTNTDTSSPNGTPFDVYQDWIAGLNPTNPASVLVMLSPPATNNTSGITVSWESVSGIDYNLLRTTSLTSVFATIQSNIVGQAGTTSYTDTTATNNTPYFYRVSVP